MPSSSSSASQWPNALSPGCSRRGAAPPSQTWRTFLANQSEILGTFTQLGSRMQGPRKVELTTNRPGMGANFRQGEGIQYFVTSTVDGYLYLFHVDADQKVVR